MIYLGLCAVACFTGSFLLLFLGEAPFLLAVHLTFAAGVMPLIFGAISHFLPVLTRSGAARGSVRALPLLFQCAGLLLAAHFYGIVGTAALQAAVGLALLTSLVFAGWLLLRVRKTLGQAHPGWRWYLAAIVALSLALLAVLAMPWWPEARQALRLLHLHLNTLGFVGLAAMGTLQVLLPTVLSGPDAEAAARLRRDLPLTAGGVLAVALGAALWWPMALFGMLVLLAVTGRLLRAWLRRYGWRKMMGDGASAALSLALFGYLLCLVLGAAHAMRWLDGHDATLAFILLFLLPLVTGALSQLMPVWRFPGVRTPARDHLRARLVHGACVRAALFVAGGVLVALGLHEGLGLAALGLILFLGGGVRAIVVHWRAAKPLQSR